jgi:hypothetical protein
MNMFDMIASAQNGGGLAQIGRQFGLDEQQTQAAVTALLPALTGGIRRNAQTGDGAQALIKALNDGNHERFLDDPDALDNDARNDGNNILRHVLGDKSVSRAAAEKAAAQTGIGAGLMKQLLPVLASMVMGSLTRQANSSQARDVLGGSQSGNVLEGVLKGVLGGDSQPAGNQQGGVMDIFGSLLDQDQDGSAMDDILDMAGKFLR